MAEDDNFFSRWSRRKVQKQAGEAVPEAPVAPVPSAATTAAPKAVPPLSTGATQVAVPAGAAPAQGDTPPAAQEKAPPPSLEDVARLTKDSDFSRFVAKDVSPDVRNAAMKKLFADPHFNVMDGLDIYIDDYSIPSPMSKDFARTLASAKFMKLFDEPEQTEQKVQAPTPGQASAQNSAQTQTPAQAPAAEPGIAVDPSKEPPAANCQPQPAKAGVADPVDTATAPDTPTSSSAP